MTAFGKESIAQDVSALSACPFPAGTTESWSRISGYIEGKRTALLSQIEALTRLANTDIWLLARRRPATPILVVIVWT
jgi:hypothetical protein